MGLSRHADGECARPSLTGEGESGTRPPRRCWEVPAVALVWRWAPSRRAADASVNRRALPLPKVAQQNFTRDRQHIVWL